jgi:3',5'-cyclic AMP phosphodiesterase CpdA
LESLFPMPSSRPVLLVILFALFGPIASVAPQPASAPADSTRLVVPPLLLRPTDDGVTINVVFEGDPERIGLELRKAGEEGAWAPGGPPTSRGPDVLEWRLTGLGAATRYHYRVHTGGDERSGARGSFVTRRPPGQPFTFALITDPHILVRDFTEQELRASPLPSAVVKRYRTEAHARWTLRMYRAYGHAILPRVSRLVLQDGPDFVINLGDIIDLHGFGFNIPVPEPRWAKKGFLDYRRLLGPLGARAPHFWVIGNWDGEKGHFTEEERRRSRGPRLRYLPNPGSDTYRAGGSANQDYYAFQWGDAFFIVLNVISYTPTEHLLDRKKDPGRPDDYTLGKEQLSWLEKTLAGATARWKFICIHHPVGGSGGDARNSAYGRGGGRAARVGEQARVHALMRQHGVRAFFYGHDHVFTDLVVDGVHYTLPGSAGAPWKFTARETGYERYWPESGYARVQVSSKRVVVTFISSEKQVLYRFFMKG